MALSHIIESKVAQIDAEITYESDLEDLDREAAELEKELQRKQDEEERLAAQAEEEEELRQLEEQSEQESLNNPLAQKIRAKDPNTSAGSGSAKAVEGKNDEAGDETAAGQDNSGIVQKPKATQEDLEEIRQKKQLMETEVFEAVCALLDDEMIAVAVGIAGWEREIAREEAAAAQKLLDERLSDQEVILHAKVHQARVRLEKREAKKVLGQRVSFLT
jgi:hypothetical protein